MGSISGRIFNQRDGLPIPQAGLKCTGEGVDKTTYSSAKGEFSFDDLPDGKYELQADADGFDNGLWGPLHVIDNQPTNIDIALQPSSFS